MRVRKGLAGTTELAEWVGQDIEVKGMAGAQEAVAVRRPVNAAEGLTHSSLLPGSSAVRTQPALQPTVNPPRTHPRGQRIRV